MSQEFASPPTYYAIYCTLCRKHISSENYNFKKLNKCSCGGYYLKKDVKDALLTLSLLELEPTEIAFLLSEMKII